MLFNSDDNNQQIHSGNYEEYFVLYIDNELNDEQMKMVDDFLALHPELQAEFDLLVGTKLPAENFSFDKNSLLADSMRLNAVDEDLLLMIDNELPAAQVPAFEKKLAADKDMQLQHALLLKTKLDASENIPYPNKEELYHHTRRVIAFRPWMRVAAAAVVIAVAGILYFNSEKSTAGLQPTVADAHPKHNNQPGSGIQTPIQQNIKPDQSQDASAADNQVADAHSSAPASNESKASDNSSEPAKDQTQKFIAKGGPEKDYNDNNITDLRHLSQPSALISGKMIDEPIATIDPQQTINNSPVTSLPPIRTTNIDPAPTDEPVATTSGPSRKSGSLKGFLRKATRVIEHRTGIDPTSDDGEILIGALALKVK